MTILPLLFQIICGGAGGNLIAAGFKSLNLGSFGNTLAGMVGGGVLGQLLQSMTGMTGMEGSSDMQIFLTSLVGGSLGGAVLTAIAGGIKGLFRRSH